MPYSNVPEDKWEAMDRCVDDVMAQGHDKESAITICHASIVEGKTESLTKSMWVSLRKADDEQHIVEGYANSEDPDSEGDLITTEAIKAALPAFMRWGAVREMHELSAVGTVLKAEVIDGDVEIDGEVYHNPLHIVAKIVDPGAWKKVKEGVYKGFSIGGHAIKSVTSKFGDKLIRKITELNWIELSLADRPVHPGARILLWKAEQKGANMSNVKRVRKAEDSDTPKVTSEQAVGLLQELRNQAELDGNLDKADMYTSAIALVLQAEGAEEAVVAEPVEEAEAEHEALGEGLAELDEELEEKAESSDEEEDEKKQLQLAARRQFGIRKTMWVTSDELHKALNGQAKTVTKSLNQPLAQLSKVVSNIDARLQRLESQPRSGGPVLRPMEKVLAGQPPVVDAEREEKKSRLSELRKAMAIEPDPLRRTQYMRDVLTLEAELSARP